jgi:hypothetical protein
MLLLAASYHVPEVQNDVIRTDILEGHIKLAGRLSGAIGRCRRERDTKTIACWTPDLLGTNNGLGQKEAVAETHRERKGSGEQRQYSTLGDLLSPPFCCRSCVKYFNDLHLLA